MLALALFAAEIPEWVGIPSGILGLGLPLLLILRGTLMLTSEHDKQMAAERQRSEIVAKTERERCEAVAAAELRRASEQYEAAELRVVDLQNRVDHLIVDRNTWREACEAQAQARLASEHASAQLIEAQQLGLGLLAALKDALARPTPGVSSGDGPRQ